MNGLQGDYPHQSRRAYLKRLIKYAAYRLLCKRVNYGLMVRIFGWFGKDYDEALGNAAHSFGADNFLNRFAASRAYRCCECLSGELQRFRAAEWHNLIFARNEAIDWPPPYPLGWSSVRAIRRTPIGSRHFASRTTAK